MSFNLIFEFKRNMVMDWKIKLEEINPSSIMFKKV